MQFGEVKYSLISAFRKLRLFHTLLKSAVRVCEHANVVQINELLAYSKNGKGIADLDN